VGHRGNFCDWSGGELVVVREVVGVYADVVGFGVAEEARGFDVAETFEESLADSVHAVHDTAVAGEDDGKAEVAVADEAGVVRDLAAGDRFCWVAVPVGLVEFADGGERYALSRNGGGDRDETVDVPGAEALRRLAEMILSAHCFPVVDSKLRLNAI
jgi:hypothetical protein